MGENMRNYLFFCPDFYPRNTGYANAFKNLIMSVLAEGEDIRIDVVTPVALGASDELNIDRLKVYRCDQCMEGGVLKHFISQKKIARFISDLDERSAYDFILFETFEYLLIFPFLPKLLLSKSAVRIHAAYETERRFFYPGLIHRFSRVVGPWVVKKYIKNIWSTNSYHLEFAKKYYLKNDLYEITGKRFQVLPNTAIVENVASEPVREGSECTLNMFTLGRMDVSGVRQKGFSDLLVALAVVKMQGDIKFSLTIVGGGAFKKDLELLVEKLNLSGEVRFIESLSHQDVLEHLMWSDVCVLPSRYEGMSMFALEAVSVGCPVIFSNAGGLLDLVQGNGYSFTPQNIDELSECVVKFSSLSLEERKQFGRNSLVLFQKNFAPEVVAKKFLLLSKVLG